MRKRNTISVMLLGATTCAMLVQRLISKLDFFSSTLEAQKSAYGSTGTIFSGAKVNTFQGQPRFFNRSRRLDDVDVFPRFIEEDCHRWAVVTTINPPTPGVISVAALTDWCMVIVADTKTPYNYMDLADFSQFSNVFFLSVDKQLEISHRFTKLIPFGSFARKNVGYIFAIRHGATVIYDFDDDNVIKAPLVPFGSEVNSTLENVLVRNPNLSSFPESSNAFNPLPYMYPSQDHIWPRGFPLGELGQSSLVNTTVSFASISSSSVGVIQAVCDGDPDFDAVFRLTRELPVNFKNHPKQLLRLLVPIEKYSPYNAQATVHRYDAFWGLLLPWTVTGRVTDIWRSYFTQRVMHELSLAVLYVGPLVKHERSPHDYVADMQAEGDLYFKTSQLLTLLERWTCREQYLPACLEHLTIDLYEHDFLGLEDVYGMQEWLLALLSIGYVFPTLRGDKLRLTPEPSEEKQPYLASPRFNVGKDELSYTEFLAESGRNGSHSNFQEWAKNLVSSTRPKQDEPIVKLILMNKDEWPLLNFWVAYHGALLGYENLYVVDGSRGQDSIHFLAHVRDHYGVNVIFSKANLNDMESCLTRVAQQISKASDFIIKMDTDEFLAARSGDARCRNNDNTPKSDCTLSPREVSRAMKNLEGENSGERLTIGWRQDAVPTSEACSNNDTSFLIGLSRFDRAKPAGKYRKTISYSKTLKGIDLGGHMNSFSAPFGTMKRRNTDFGIIHFQRTCLQREMLKCRKVLASHEYFAEDDSNRQAKDKLLKIFNLQDDKDTICFGKPYLSGFSCDKALLYLRYLYGCVNEKSWYGNVSKHPYQNPDFIDFAKRLVPFQHITP